MMDPQDFIRLSIGSLGIRIPMAASKPMKGATHATSTSIYCCQIRLRGFPIQTAQIPLISSSEPNPDPQNNPIIFYLGKSDVKALMASSCFHTSQPFLEVVVFLGRKKGSNCSVTSKKQQLGTFKVEVSPEWGEGKPPLIHNGWIEIGKQKQLGGRQGPELHLRVKLDSDPRYVFLFEDETMLSPQIVQVHGSIKQPVFSCKFSRERRACQLDPLGTYWSNSNDDETQDIEQRRERKGWKVMIHDLSGSAAAAAFQCNTAFVASSGFDRSLASKPWCWLIVPWPRPPAGSVRSSWHPDGAVSKAWREAWLPQTPVCLRLFLLPEGQEGGVLVSEVLVSAGKGGEFLIDMDRQAPAGTPVHCPPGTTVEETGGFVMSCRVQGEGKRSKPVVQLAMRHVMCVEDAAIFMALAGAVDLSIEACRPFTKKMKKGIRSSLLS
ncbi:LOW QUALITY PROTEIN: uncharacterized protein LOC109819833 [Asparagus officinalis]|uniref:LOW QUALITY PROTEIN: uncharacterized protein LOC109819833 n=1 Tax=Asparagus officinalis TaxID=4686 RepID=UPI00098E46A9|nr:LOW QUALITY PROTEIN: uncharacterized protein LOC109819833 [Asparagus officinalis]